MSHAHLDHVGGVPYIAPRYNVPVLGTPYTMEVLNVLMEDSNQKIRNRIIPVQLNGSYLIKGRSGTYKAEFINITHSTLQCAIVAIHTNYGIVMYANDYKLDNSPVLGDKPNYARLRELSKIGVKALIVDCLYAPDDRKTPSEKIARGLLEDVLFTTDNKKSGIIVTTFSSHIARLKTISEFGKRLNREVVFVGRSLIKYVSAANRVIKTPFFNQIQLASYRNQVQKMLKKINRNREKYIVVCTGHQGEPGSVLDRIARHQLPLRLNPNDHVIFSSKTIPTPINEENKQQLERRLKKHHVRIFDNVHTSGHGGREDLRDLINLLKPEHIIPSHGDVRKLTAGASLAIEMGYKLNKSVHILQNGQMLNLT